MSFSTDVKEELSRQMPRTRHCRLAELSAVLFFGGRINVLRDNLKISTDNVVIAKKYYSLIKRLFSCDVSMNIEDGGKQKRYTIEVNGADAVKDILDQAYFDSPEECETMLLKKDCCRRSFLRGVYMLNGFANDPSKFYHMEISVQGKGNAEWLAGMLESYGVNARVVKRKSRYITYVKESDSVIDMLNVMGAFKASNNLENVRIVKNMKNSANRQYNCDSANINKVIKASAKQIEDIKLIDSCLGLDSLSKPLREIAIARLEHPEESLTSLGERMDPPVGKSGINHRMRKLAAMAEDLKK